MSPRAGKPADPLYPDITPYRHGMLQVSSVHDLYFEESGNPQGKPVVFLHGGPGGGTNPRMRRFFDPLRYRIVLFDQRGCGKSTPHASLVDNTTWDLVADIEQLRGHLGVDRWQVFGGSWGSTLALAYAQRQPERVTELVLRGIFLLRHCELEWFYQHETGAASVFPDYWEQFVAVIPEDERHDMMAAYYKRLTSSNPMELNRAARAWSTWEGATSYLHPNKSCIADFEDPTFAAAFARIECHYFVNRGFLDADDQLLRDAHLIKNIPGVIVQGRYDIVCPMRSAWALHRAWPKAQLRVVPDSGHSAFEHGTMVELVRATDRFARE
ncbi:MAG: prolyl aminopeptidase [Steroidobacteraceae bacterium]